MTTLADLARRSLAVAALALASGCVDVRLFDLSVVSNRALSLDAPDLNAVPVERRVEGRDEVWSVLFVPFGRYTLEGAVDDALERGDGDLMVDAVVRVRGWSTFLVGRHALVVTGDVYRTIDHGGDR